MGKNKVGEQQPQRQAPSFAFARAADLSLIYGYFLLFTQFAALSNNILRPSPKILFSFSLAGLQWEKSANEKEVLCQCQASGK